MIYSLRYIVAIHLGDYLSSPEQMKRDIENAARSTGFKGTIDDPEQHAKFILFDTETQADEMVSRAKDIGFTTAGKLEYPAAI